MTESGNGQTGRTTVPELIGVGSPLVDYLLPVEHRFLADHVAGAKGGMEMVAVDVIHGILGKSAAPPTQVPGRS